VQYTEKIEIGAGYASPRGSIMVIEATRCDCHWQFSGKVTGIVAQGATATFDHKADCGWYCFTSAGQFTLRTGPDAKAWRQMKRRGAAS
jgi:hypothetical protein